MRTLTITLSGALLLAACRTSHVDQARADVTRTIRAAAVVNLRGSDGTPHGTLQLDAIAGGGVRLTGTLTGLPPGPHGIHLHAAGRCEPPGFESAGGHFNPQGRQHGLRNPAGPHAGDAPNIVADASGRAAVDLTFAGASLEEAGARSLRDADGAAVVVHASQDDQVTDPSGNSGARIACGVIEQAR
jgi:superoxide dismutase, Cu-Zn family